MPLHVLWDYFRCTVTEGEQAFEKNYFRCTATGGEQAFEKILRSSDLMFHPELNDFWMKMNCRASSPCTMAPVQSTPPASTDIPRPVATRPPFPRSAAPPP